MASLWLRTADSAQPAPLALSTRGSPANRRQGAPPPRLILSRIAFAQRLRRIFWRRAPGGRQARVARLGGRGPCREAIFSEPARHAGGVLGAPTLLVDMVRTTTVISCRQAACMLRRHGR